ncbi:hypothetical protein NC653_026627 [Populus alba x Populus x berolinensis]|uniref:PGG domain-containing protein n=1 Tax=Populus alba x Populus x berolinensis TaxID=444605 RepID=A0AAD6MFJ0_9ROSI|nr:hypothetical protein NC653_026627 [Populus alba x Populus x berolinensis]
MASPMEEGTFASIDGRKKETCFAAKFRILSNSGKRIDQAGKKKYVKQVTGRHNDTELHLAAQRGNLADVQRILNDISKMMGTSSGDDFDAEVAEIRASVVNEVNELGVTALFTAADKGHLEVVKELLQYSNKECLTRKNRSGYDSLHIAAFQGHHAIVQVLDGDHDPSLSQTHGPSNATPLVSAVYNEGILSVVIEYAVKGRLACWRFLDLMGKMRCQFSCPTGTCRYCKSICLSKDPQLARRTDKERADLALQMAVKGQSVMRWMLAIVMLPDKFGNYSIACSNKEKRELRFEFFFFADTEELTLSERINRYKGSAFLCYGALRANELNQTKGMNVHTQLEQNRRTNKNVHKISKELRKLQREGINNATNSVTVVAKCYLRPLLFAAIFTVPLVVIRISGGGVGTAVVGVTHASFQNLLHNLMLSLSSHPWLLWWFKITLVRGEDQKQRGEWLASVCTFSGFYGLLLHRGWVVNMEWAAMLNYYCWWCFNGWSSWNHDLLCGEVQEDSLNVGKKDKMHARRSGSSSWQHNSEFSNSEG